jgi:hypothetical protein
MMRIEIEDPEILAIIQRRMESGRFESVEAVIADAVRSYKPLHQPPVDFQERKHVDTEQEK